jgi:hypothetical protein
MCVILSYIGDTMNNSKFSSSLKRVLLVALVLVLGLTTLGINAAYASSGVCVHPTGAGRCFTSVQAAVDAANDGASITIWKGVYTEQVTIIGKNLTLLGRPGAVIQAPANMEDTLSLVAGTEGRPIILVNNADVTIRGLTVDGANSAGTNPAIQGITFINADGVIRDNTVKGVGFGTPTLPVVDDFPIYMGEGIVVVNFEPTLRTVTITENLVTNYNTVGITVFAEADPNDPTLSTLTVNVLNNTVIGSGPNDALDQWGIFFGGYNFADPQFSISGSIKGNRIQNQFTNAPYPLPGVGIATYSTANVDMSDNTIENVNVGLVANQAVGAQIMRNQITGRSQDVYGSTGLILSGRDTQVIENRIRKMETGILLFVDDASFGSSVNTVLKGNQLDRVTMDLTTSLGASLSLASVENSNPNKKHGHHDEDVWKRVRNH